MFVTEELVNDKVGPVSLTLRPGECLGIGGASGSGKTLLLRMLADLDPHAGRMAVYGQDSRSMPASEWRRRVGMLPADSQWWAATVGEHFHLPDITVLEALGFDDRVLGWRMERLSSGERQRLALARLLQNQPDVLLLDEPTANLDAASAARVETLLTDLREQRGGMLIWVGHDPAQLQRVSDRVMLMRDGRLQ